MLTFVDPITVPVLGTIFGERRAIASRLEEGDRLILVPDPPGAEVPAVWVHASGGDVVGHVPDQIAAWLAPWMLAGGCCSASVRRVSSDDVASWKRLTIRVQPHPAEPDATDG